MTEFSSITQIKLMLTAPVQIIPKHVKRNCFRYFHGSKNWKLLVNRKPQPSKSWHWVCAQQFQFGHCHVEAEAGKCFHICEDKLVLNSREFQSSLPPTFTPMKEKVSFAFILLLFLRSGKKGDIALLHVCHHISRSLRPNLSNRSKSEIFPNYSELYIYVNLSIH